MPRAPKAPVAISTLRRLVAAGPAVFAVTTLPAVAFAAEVFGVETATAVAVVGWVLLTPLSAIVSEGERDVVDGDGADGGRPVDVPNPWWGTWETREPEPGDPLDRLRERYAEGEIDEAEFERRLGLLLDTEDADPATARERVRERPGRND